MYLIFLIDGFRNFERFVLNLVWKSCDCFENTISPQLQYVECKVRFQKRNGAPSSYARARRNWQKAFRLARAHRVLKELWVQREFVIALQKFRCDLRLQGIITWTELWDVRTTIPADDFRCLQTVTILQFSFLLEEEWDLENLSLQKELL